MRMRMLVDKSIWQGLFFCSGWARGGGLDAVAWVDF